MSSATLSVSGANGNGVYPSSNGNGNGNGNGWRGGSALRKLPAVNVHGVQLHAITEAQSIQHILSELDAGRGGVVVTPNLDHLRRASNDLEFGAMVAEADLVLADGMPLVWASRLQGTPLPERVAGSNLISSLSAAAGQRGRTLFLLGGAEGTAEAAARVLTERFPDVKIAGTYYPQIGFEEDAKSMAHIVEVLSAARPDIIYVALGSPKQERLIARLRPILPRAWWLGVGVSFSFLCGDVRRAPLWMQRCGLEWAHRLFQEPRRLFHRYIVLGVPFAAALLGRATLNGLPRRLGRRRAPVNGSHNQKPPANANGHPALDNSDGNGRASAESAASIAAPAERQRVDESIAGDGMNGDVYVSAASRSTSPAGLGAPAPLSRLRAVVLLGGSVRPSALCTWTNRSALDLPLDENGSILTYWLSQATELAGVAGLDKLPVRVMVNQTSREPVSADPKYFGTFRVERDLSEYRGTGGVLRDLAGDYADDDLILVANAAQVLLDPLATIAAAMARKASDVAVISHADGTPSGVMLVACKTLRLIPEAGFVDMKEQGLALIARQFDVRVVKRRRPTGLPIRSLEDYIQALRFHHRRRQGKPAATDPLAEDWSPTFSLVEAGASVDASARVHDSVVLKGATVEAGAVLVRSVVCSEGVVRRDKSAVDQFVGGSGDRKPRKGRGFEVVVPESARAAAGVLAAAVPLPAPAAGRS